MKALIFGGMGLLGFDLTRTLIARGHDGVALGRTEGDVTDPTAIRRAVDVHAPDVLFNLAAYTRVDQAEADPGEAFAVNSAGARNVASAAAQAGLPIVHISTDYVFDGRKRAGYGEWDPISPLSVYGRSKALGEFQVRAIQPRHIIVRTQWLYGAGGPNFVEAMLRKGAQCAAIPVVDDQVGSPTYAADLADALVTLADVRAYGTYHVTNSGRCTWKQFAEAIFRLTHMTVQVEGITTAALGRSARRPLHSVLINQMWVADGYPPLRSWEEALADYLIRRTGDA